MAAMANFVTERGSGFLEEETQFAAAPGERDLDLYNDETFGCQETWDMDNQERMPDFFINQGSDDNLSDLDVTHVKSEGNLRGDIVTSLDRLVEDFDADSLGLSPARNVHSKQKEPTNLDDLFGPSPPAGIADPETILYGKSDIWGSPQQSAGFLKGFKNSPQETYFPLGNMQELKASENSEKKPGLEPLPLKAITLEELEQSMMRESQPSDAMDETPSVSNISQGTSSSTLGTPPQSGFVRPLLSSAISSTASIPSNSGLNTSVPVPPQLAAMQQIRWQNVRPLQHQHRSPMQLAMYCSDGYVRGTFPMMHDQGPRRMPLMRGSPQMMLRQHVFHVENGQRQQFMRTPPPLGWHARHVGSGPYTDPGQVHQRWSSPRGPVHQVRPRTDSVLPPPELRREEQGPRRRLLADHTEPGDPYAGLMSQREKDSVVRIQLLQLHSEKPYIDDYYYVRCNEKKKAFNDKRKEDSSRRRFSDFVVEDRNYKPRQFDGALGKVTASSISHPRHIIDLPKANQSEEDPNEKQKSERRKFRKLLLHIEKGYSLVLELEDVLRESTPEEDRASESTLRRQLGELLLAPPEGFLSLSAVRKGRALLLRALPLVPHDCALAVVKQLIRFSAEMNKREPSAEFAASASEVVRTVLEQAPRDELLLMANLLEAVQIKAALKNQFGSTVVCTLVNCGQQFFGAPGPHTQQWSSVLLAVSDHLCGEEPVASSVARGLHQKKLEACFGCLPAALESASFGQRLALLCPPDS